MFVNSESTTGYVLAFTVYIGGSDSTSTQDTVMSLMSKYLDKGHKLFMDIKRVLCVLVFKMLQRKKILKLPLTATSTCVLAPVLRITIPLLITNTDCCLSCC